MPETFFVGLCGASKLPAVAIVPVAQWAEKGINEAIRYLLGRLLEG